MSTVRNSPAPERSMLQRMSALESANEVRSYRADLKREIAAGRVVVVNILLDPPKLIATMKIFDLLVSIPRVGRVKANKFLSACRISPSKTIEGMSERQRKEIIDILRRRL